MPLILAGPLLVLLPFFVADITQRVAIDAAGITVTRWPLPRQHVPAAILERKYTPDRWLLHVSGRRRPISLNLASMENAGVIRAATLHLATANGVPVEESPVYRELADDQ